MKDSIKTFSKIALKTSFKWFTIVEIGSLFSIITLITAFVLMNNGDVEDQGFISDFTQSVSNEFFTALLLISSIVFVLLYIVVANKTAIHTAIYMVWDQKINGFIAPKIASLIEKIIAKQPNWLKGISDSAALKLRLIDENKSDNKSSKIQKKVLNYGLQKTQLDDIDLHKEGLNLPEAIANKINDKISDAAEPSLKLFWMVMGVHALILILAIVFDT